MCGRYALALRPSQIMQMLRDDNMPVYETPDDPDEDGAEDDTESESVTPRQSYNFAPSYNGVVYRADVPDWGAGSRPRHDGQAPPSDGDVSADYETHDDDDDDDDDDNDHHQGQQQPLPANSASSNNNNNNRSSSSSANNTEKDNGKDDPRYKLQAMKWGLVPFWTKRDAGHGSAMKTINCRDDSLAASGGLWSTMKARKRCVVVAQGFYEWLKKDGGREKVPHYVRRRDGRLMCFAGLWDVVRFEDNGEKLYTYTIVTTSSNKQLRFLHDRMPVILENGSEAMRKWLDPGRYEWSKELQSLLVPYDNDSSSKGQDSGSGNALEVYPVSQEVGKVGNDSPMFIVPVDSKENKANIANFFAIADKKNKKEEEEHVKMEKMEKVKEEDKEDDEEFTWPDDHIVKTEKQQPEIKMSPNRGFVSQDTKGEDQVDGEKRPIAIKREASSPSPSSQPDRKKKISATRNHTATAAARSPNKTASAKAKADAAGSRKITQFFANSS